jgi:hypothetical protein
MPRNKSDEAVSVVSFISSSVYWLYTLSYEQQSLTVSLYKLTTLSNNDKQL